MHFAANLADVADNATALNSTRIHILHATANEITNHTVNSINATVKAIAAAEPSKLSTQMPWIQLGLIPIVPVVACYFFTKLADYLLDLITAYRHRETAPRLWVPDGMLADGEQAAEDKNKVHIGTPGTRLGNSALPHGAAESSRLAGANAENPVIIGNSHAFEQGEAATLTRGTRSRVFERGGIRGGVRSSKRGSGGHVEQREQLVRRRESVGGQPVARANAHGSGWWFDARWF